MLAECAGGAEALGHVIVDQPDLLVTAHPLTPDSTERLLAGVRRFAPCTGWRCWPPNPAPKS